MRRRSAVAVLLPLLALGGAACDSGTGVEADPEAVIGTWVSAGDARAPYYRIETNRDSILATFGGDGTWFSAEYYGDGSQPFTRTGVYEIDEGDGPIFGLTVLAEPPAGDTLYRGIFRVVGDTMQLEMVGQGQYTPPTVEGGFGSTQQDGVETGSYWIQVYTRRTPPTPDS